MPKTGSVQTEVNDKHSYIAKNNSDAGTSTTHTFREINSEIVTKYLVHVNVCKKYISPHFNPHLLVSFIDF